MRRIGGEQWMRSNWVVTSLPSTIVDGQLFFNYVAKKLRRSNKKEMKKLLCLGLLGFLLSCNDSGVTPRPTDLDNTDVDDSTSAKSNLPWHDTLNATKDTIALDSLKNTPTKK